MSSTVWIGITHKDSKVLWSAFDTFLFTKKSHTQNAILKSKKSVLNLILLFNRAAENDLKMWPYGVKIQNQGKNEIL